MYIDNEGQRVLQALLPQSVKAFAAEKRHKKNGVELIE